MSNNMKFAMLFPILAIITIASFAGGLGVVFMLLNNSATEEIGVIVLGSSIVVGVPVVAYLLVYLFQSGPPHALGQRCVRIEGCADTCLR